MCPQRDLLVTRGAREADALVHQPGAQAKAAPLRIDQQQAEAGDARLSVLHQHDAADIFSVGLCDPAAFQLGIEVVDEIGNDLSAQAFKRFSPAVFLCIELGMA